MLTIKNGLVFTEKEKFERLDVTIENDTIKSVSSQGSDTSKCDDIIDASEKYVIPGFVDIHIHGFMGADVCDANNEALSTMAQHLAKRGTTSFCATTMAYDEQTLSTIIKNYAEFKSEKYDGARILGINMEGPFFNKQKKGAQPEKYIVPPDLAFFNRMFDLSNGEIKLVDIAPEEDGALDFIESASKKCTVSLAHTAATYDTATQAFEKGASHATHLFNGMSAFHHTAPGVVGSAFDNAKYVEIISDGVHLHECMVRAVFAMFTKQRVCLISDCTRAGGMNEGEYMLGGQQVYLKDGAVRLESGVLAGSASTVHMCVKKAVSFGIPLESALQCATHNPAKAVGVFDTVGSITNGKRADIIIADKDLNIERIILGGEVIL